MVSQNHSLVTWGVGGSIHGLIRLGWDNTIQPKWLAAAAAAKSLQPCLTLCNPTDGSPPGSRIPGIIQARTLEWVAISFSNAWKRKVKVKSLSRAQLFSTPWAVAYQAPPSMGFPRQEYWSGVPLPSPPCRLHSLKFFNEISERVKSWMKIWWYLQNTGIRKDFLCIISW